MTRFPVRNLATSERAVQPGGVTPGGHTYPRGGRLPYLPGLDGMRALAVIAVLLYHSGGGAFVPGGFLGVEVFFVISGYLITSSSSPSGAPQDESSSRLSGWGGREGCCQRSMWFW